jgi:hypothetical protein
MQQARMRLQWTRRPPRQFVGEVAPRPLVGIAPRVLAHTEICPAMGERLPPPTVTRHRIERGVAPRATLLRAVTPVKAASLGHRRRPPARTTACGSSAGIARAARKLEVARPTAAASTRRAGRIERIRSSASSTVQSRSCLPGELSGLDERCHGGPISHRAARARYRAPVYGGLLSGSQTRKWCAGLQRLMLHRPSRNEPLHRGPSARLESARVRAMLAYALGSTPQLLPNCGIIVPNQAVSRKHGASRNPPHRL